MCDHVTVWPYLVTVDRALQAVVDGHVLPARNTDFSTELKG